MDIKPKRKKSSWILALEEWNKSHKTGCFLMPKKSSKEYAEVKKIQEKLDSKTPAPKRNIKFIKKAPAKKEEKIIGILPFDNQAYNMAKKMVNDLIKKNNVKFNQTEKDKLYLDAYNLLVKEKVKQAPAKKAPAPKKAPKKRNIKMDLSPAPAPAPAPKKRGRPKKGSGIEDIIYNNRETIMDLADLAYNRQEAPTFKDGKIEPPVSPLEKLLGIRF